MADGITRIAVEGFKSISKRQSVDIAPLTILAGANSSGKSSIMQPLLMLKQTLEAPHDPGPLLISGSAPNVKFTSTDQFFSRKSSPRPPRLTIQITLQRGAKFHTTFQKSASGVQVVEQTYTTFGGTTPTLRPDMTAEEIAEHLNQPELLGLRDLIVAPRRFILGVSSLEMPWGSGSEWVVPFLLGTLHVSALRGSPTRTYSAAAVRSEFPGTFEHYAASVVAEWKNNEDARGLNADLEHLGLAQRVSAKRLSDAEIDLQVNLLTNGTTSELVSVADVGFGVSQAIPPLVALRVAGSGQLVYLEEPEIHLHPRAQVKLADILANAAKRGVRVVAETHSTLLLTAIQTLVAKGELSPELVKLHWFQRDPKTGVTKVTSTDLDENGAFTDSEWPEDFDDVILKADGAYLDAVEGRQVR
jgi:hypothetical protein